MKENMSEKIYLIAAIDCIINGNTYNKVDLGNYELEYLVGEEERITLMQDEGGIPSLQIQVKLRNKITMNIEWVEIYYKSLKKYSFNDIFNLPIQDKKNFIFRAETFISRKKYATSVFVIPSDFLHDLPKNVDMYDYSSTTMPQSLTKDAKKEILQYLENLLYEVDQKLETPNEPRLNK